AFPPGVGSHDRLKHILVQSCRGALVLLRTRRTIIPVLVPFDDNAALEVEAVFARPLHTAGGAAATAHGITKRAGVSTHANSAGRRIVLFALFAVGDDIGAVIHFVCFIGHAPAGNHVLFGFADVAVHLFDAAVARCHTGG